MGQPSINSTLRSPTQTSTWCSKGECGRLARKVKYAAEGNDELKDLFVDKDKSILCLDAGISNPKPQQIPLDELSKGWDGSVILLKAKLKIFEETSELKIGWLPRQRCALKTFMIF